jgi:metal-sulfur cluster biosynthetic enzyme
MNKQRILKASPFPLRPASGGERVPEGRVRGCEKINKRRILKAIGGILDPELHISLVDLGLIYKVTVKNDQVNVLMTLTTPACPLADTIKKHVEDKIKSLSGVKNASVDFTFDPPWTPDLIAPEIKFKLGLIK